VVSATAPPAVVAADVLTALSKERDVSLPPEERS
jgi:hypothetical protein